MKKIRRVASQAEVQTEKAKDVTIKYTEYGRLRAVVEAPTVLRHLTKNPRTEMPDGVKVKIFNDTLGVKSRIKADRGVRYKKEDKMKAEGNVVVINDEGKRLDTEKLIWDVRKEKVFTDQFVKITTGDEVLYGEGLRANQDLTNAEILNPKGEIQIEKPTENEQSSP